MKRRQYVCPKCGQRIGAPTDKPPTCQNPNSPWCARRGVVMEREDSE